MAKSPRSAYTYDLVGNRTSETSRTVVGTQATTVTTDYTYDAAYQLLTQSVAGTPTVTNTWSANGALATSTTPMGTQVFTTDLTDELISLELADGSTVGYTHDASGNRTSRTVDGLLDASWAWDDLSSLPMRIGEYEASGTLATAWLADPTSSTGASLAQTSGGSSSWLLNDPFANTVASVSTTGSTVSGTRTMDAFGVERLSATGSLADAQVGFAGQYLDSATGLYDMRARDYDPTSGRFTATDPVAVPTGMPFVAGYSYSYNNPLMLSDVSGLKPLGQFDHADGGMYRPGPNTSGVASTTGVGTLTAQGITNNCGPVSLAPGVMGMAQAADELFSALPGIQELFTTSADLANELVSMADLATSLARKLAAGEKVGSYLAKFRLDRNELLHYFAQWGRNRFVRAFSQIFGGAEADTVYFLVDTVNHYKNDYAVIANQTDRWQFSAKHAFISWSTGTAWDIGTDRGKEAICLLSGATLCGAAIVGQGAIGWGAQNIAGDEYRRQVLCDHAGICPLDPEIHPSMWGTFDPDGKPM